MGREEKKTGRSESRRKPRDEGERRARETDQTKCKFIRQPKLRFCNEPKTELIALTMEEARTLARARHSTAVLGTESRRVVVGARSWC